MKIIFTRTLFLKLLILCFIYKGTAQTPDFTDQQGYLFDETAPDVIGINIKYAWDKGIFGQGIKVVDVEHNWNFDHEDLKSPRLKRVTTEVKNNLETNHGDAVLGILFGQDNGFGITGAVHKIDSLFCASTSRPGMVSNIALPIKRLDLALSDAISKLDKGDVLILEQQKKGPNDKFVPSDYKTVIWSLIKKATDSGIIVVAAAGNGNENLDAPEFDDYRNRGDNGSIIVGNGTRKGRFRRFTSTYGSPLHLQGWGDESVFTTGYGDAYNANKNALYTAEFSGTSSATPIVASAVIALQSYAKNEYGIILPPRHIRSLLIETGTLSNATEHIGPLPNVKRAFEKLDKLYATPSFTVQFQDFDDTILKSVNARYGEKVIPPTVSVRDGFQFFKWDETTDWISKNTVVSALYIPAGTNHKVTFRDAEDNIIKETIINHGEEAIAPEGPKTNNSSEFSGWDTVFFNVTKDIDVRPIYELAEIAYIVRFNDFDGTNIGGTLLAKGNTPIAPETPERKGFIFVGWDKDFSNVTSDLTITAQYEALLSVTDTSINDLRIYPNPVKDKINIKLNSRLEMFNYQIHDITGKIISSGTSKNTVDVTHFPSGVYIVNILFKNRSVSKKIVKID